MNGRVVPVNLEVLCVCACSSELLSLPVREEEGTQVPVSMFLKSSVKGSSLLEQCM